MFNIYSIGHFLQWFIVGRFILSNWLIFLLLSIGWELLEFYLPFEFAVEKLENKFTDIIINCVGFYLGNYLKKINNDYIF